MKNSLYIIKLLLNLLVLMTLAGCSKVQSAIEQPKEKVEIRLYNQALDYSVPKTRAGAADENAVAELPWVLVFRGAMLSTATYVESAQVYKKGTGYYVDLTTQNEPCSILIYSNNQSNLTWGTNDSWSSAYSTLFFDRLKTDYAEYNTIIKSSRMYNTLPLTTPRQVGVPFINQPLAMSGLYDVDEITATTTIGTADEPMQLERVMAKVVVRAPTSSGVKLIGATVANVRNKGWLYRPYGDTYMPTTHPLTLYVAESGDIENVAAANAEGTSTEDNPIYIYETSSGDEPAVIVKAEYDGAVYYYKLAFVDASMQSMNIFRNRNYIFNMTNVNTAGYASLDEALNSEYHSNVSYALMVEDATSHEIMDSDNGVYYVGLSNSIFVVYGKAAISDLPAFTVAIKGETANISHRKVSVVDGSAGLRIKTPTDKNGSAMDLTDDITDVIVNLKGNFTAGSLLVEVGAIKKTITIKRDLSIGVLNRIPWYGQVISFIEDSDYSYISGEALLSDYVSKEWVDFSPTGEDVDRVGAFTYSVDGITVISPPAITTDSGSLHLHVLENTSNHARSGAVVYISRLNKNNGTVERIKYHLRQEGR